MKRYRTYILWGIVGLFVLSMLVIAFIPKAVVVVTAKAERGDLIETLTAEGTTRYHDTYVVSAPISGQLTRTSLEVGARVTQDEPLAEILPPQLDSRFVEELRSRLESTRALEQEASNHVSTAKTTLAQAVRDRDRFASLYAAGAATREQYERDSDAAAQAEQDLHAAEARARSAHHDAEAISAQIASAGTGGVTPVRLVAPVGGILLQVHEKNAREVQAGMPLFEVGDTSRMEIVIDLLSSDAPRVHPGDSVLVTVPGIETRLHATVRLIEPDAYIKISPLGIEEKRVNVIATLNERAPDLGSTYRVDATMMLWSGKDILKVPLSALYRNGKDWYVYTIREGRAHEQKVAIDHRNDAEVQIVSGLSAGDMVIVHPSNEIAEGVRVKQ